MIVRFFINLSPSEAYLEHIRTFTMELFWENSKQLKAVNYFHKKMWMFDWILNTPLPPSPLPHDGRSFLYLPQPSLMW